MMSATLISDEVMKGVLDYPLAETEAAFWWLGQAGYLIRVKDTTIVIDPYLSDSASAGAPEFRRLYPPVIDPNELKAEIWIITHNHADHLDPETIAAYRFKADTWFVAPWLTAEALEGAGIPAERIIVINAGQTRYFGNHQITGVYAIPTGADVLDTTGYLVRFGNGRTVYHTSDTQYHPLVLKAAPKQADVMLVPINGKWDNPGPEQAALMAEALEPKFVFPNHYDTMELNAENPRVFQWFCENKGLSAKALITERMQPFVWQ